MHGIVFLRCHARLKSRLRAAVMWQMHVINKPSFVLCSFQIILPAVAVMAGALDFTVCYDLTKVYISTLRIVWTRRCCIYHGSKMGMTPQRMLCTLKGSGSVSLRSTLSCAVLACSRLRDGGGKSFSNEKCEKRSGAGERQGGGACTHFFNGLFRYISSWYTLWLVNCDS